ncbi:MAG: menaquinone biosynthesis protein [Acidobacteria bacterium]|nr:menaquinone biosynthesis protein [Acidobacteriota bacterium]
MRPARVGAVSYLNARPLVWGLDARPDLFSLRVDLPSRCARLLHDGDTDLGLIPAIEYQMGEYLVVPDVAIGADGPVQSVAVFSSRPIGEVRSVALDTSSRSSVALTRVLAHHHWKITPTYVSAEPDLDQMLGASDAALLIGDPALDVDAPARGLRKYDLSEAWKAMTGLPFVFAVWAGRADAIDAEQVDLLQRARDAGLVAAERIAAEHVGADALRQQAAVSYLRDTLNYRFGARERQGLALFHQLAAEQALVPAWRPLRLFS